MRQKDGFTVAGPRSPDVRGHPRGFADDEAVFAEHAKNQNEDKPSLETTIGSQDYLNLRNTDRDRRLTRCRLAEYYIIPSDAGLIPAKV